MKSLKSPFVTFAALLAAAGISFSATAHGADVISCDSGKAVISTHELYDYVMRFYDEDLYNALGGDWDLISENYPGLATEDSVFATPLYVNEIFDNFVRFEGGRGTGSIFKIITVNGGVDFQVWGGGRYSRTLQENVFFPFGSCAVNFDVIQEN